MTKLAETRDLLHAELIRNQIVRSCLNCECFDKKQDKCLHFDLKPPAHVIVFSCVTEWIGEIPF